MIGGRVKDIVKRGRVKVWTLGKGCCVQAELGATEWDLLQAMDAEEELNLYRERAGDN